MKVRLIPLRMMSSAASPIFSDGGSAGNNSPRHSRYVCIDLLRRSPDGGAQFSGRLPPGCLRSPTWLSSDVAERLCGRGGQLPSRRVSHGGGGRGDLFPSVCVHGCFFSFPNVPPSLSLPLSLCAFPAAPNRRIERRAHARSTPPGPCLTGVIAE